MLEAVQNDLQNNYGTALICDDDPVLRDIESRLLSDAGWGVVGSVGMALDAISLAHALHPDVVVLDMAMTGLSGLDAIPELTAAGCSVVVCSAFGSMNEPAIKAGAVAVVDKAQLADLVVVLDALSQAHA